MQVYGAADIAHAACICVHKKHLYQSVKKLRAMGGSGVLVSPMVYIFDEEPKRWHTLLSELGINDDPMKSMNEHA
jgi:ATP phosphoribosyltransferase